MPVDLPVLAAFALAAAAVVISPGPDTLLILRAGLAGGRRDAFAAVAGVQAGLIVHTALAALGVSAVIAAWPAALKAVAIAGALYLGWLGAKALRGAASTAPANDRRRAGAMSAFRDAVATNLLNPKVILLFLALFPNFIDPGRGAVGRQLATLAATLIAINLAWQGPMAWAAARFARRLAEPRTARRLSAATGGAFLGFAVLLLVSHVL